MHRLSTFLCTLPLVALAATALAAPPAADPFDALLDVLSATTPANRAETKGLTAAKRVLARRSLDLKGDVSRTNALAKILGKAFVNDADIQDALDVVLDEMELDVASERDALAQRAAAYADGKPKTNAQTRLDSATTKLESAHAAAKREEKANEIGAALQDVLRAEAYLKDDIYFYVVVNGQALFLNKMADQVTGSDGFINADSRGDIFALQGVGFYGQDSLHDVVSVAIAGFPKERSYDLQDYMATHSRQDNQGNAPDGYREIIVPGYDSYVKFLRVDRKKHIVAGVFQFTVHEDNDVSKVDRVRYGSFRATFL